MYLHLGQNEIVPDHRIIGIFDLDKCSYEKRTREYLTRAEKDGVVLDVSGDLPKSFVVCDHPYHPQIVYLSQLNTSTLKNRDRKSTRLNSSHWNKSRMPSSA